MLQRWISVTEPEFPWEREALDYIRGRFPDQDPFRAWSNFKFVAEDGSLNEIDLLSRFAVQDLSRGDQKSAGLRVG